jgi:riboflavin kinase/FMN adenylyltransferase
MNFYLHECGKLWQTEIPKGTNLAVALGCFDGVHAGHKALLKEVIEDSSGLVSAIWTFSEPLTKPYIEKVEDRIKLCAAYGIKIAICESFEKFRGMTPSEFISYLAELSVKKIVCGEDFRFGKDRSGDVSSLKSECEKHGIELKIIAPIYADIDGKTEKVSSTLIRNLITEGRPDKAAELLGRQFTVSGVVVSGNNLGRTIQVPTLNQRFEACRIVPKHGVYATTCTVNGKNYPSVTNVGTRPTVIAGSHEENCETHIIGEKLDLYGEIASVNFHAYIRPETKFASLDELRAQITKDIEFSMNYFNK